ncbi:hypothetical protein SY83_08665 [Paenibacillus swuensis]|uniref:Lipoprotein n=1 Tax=Paenibacillus swuensis TaxID=1178515 RepID=A0A172TH04_9BACL|nr:DUF6376 family protein [Paenibacillus swuensis]ANE46338.1 hypothetical protein SY83_08665 [Paenibacillus swuensis]
MKWKLVILLMAVLVLPACSLLESATSTVNYANEATTYISDATAFAERVPQMAEQAVNNSEALTSLVNELESMKDKALAFNATDAPALAQDLHDQLVSRNETLLAEINKYLDQIQGATVDWGNLQQAPLFQAVSDITQLLERIKNLGQ